ncbi:MAG: hypothetical protein QOF99_5000, partial [Pseudonocardiales bacterium]|nr:hypothetical protein [Pseudonocardiales bacterium]
GRSGAGRADALDECAVVVVVPAEGLHRGRARTAYETPRALR